MTESASIRVLIADDNRPFRRGVRLRLENADGITVVGEAATGRDAVKGALAEHADVVLMDLEMPEMNGIDATRTVVEESGGSTRVIALTSHGEDHLVMSALSSGASGYLLKTHDSSQLVDAIRAAHRGEALMSSRVTRSVLTDIARRRITDQDRATAASLSPSEARVVSLLSDGITSNEQLAAELVVSINTVRSHVQSSMRKTGAADRTQLALWGVRVRSVLAAHPNG
ncbi:DNA-binding response regulator [Microbacterium sp. CSI-V]|uniref:response regulator n=1 Tax=unclassified Microbacterium TaxID=2609290 RepID=UPI00097BF1AF|nr:response regulator transcription factor [Microbacterium sp. CSI-V]MXS75736.1 response regulator transcription factor [Microbacterium sp. TL13]ONI64825.1 DNA-binding response regulator [Microbacterium sp. CSI-V]